MNQERFDDLAAGLANNSLSRRQVLKSLATGLLLSGPLGALWAKPASAARCPTCGECTEVSINTASNTVKQAKCTGAIECTAESLCQQANKKARYRKLERYLKNKGFKASAAPQAMVLREDGRLVRKIFGTFYTNSARGQNAMLTYAQEASGKAKAWAVVAEGNVVKYALVFDSAGQITVGRAPKGQPQTNTPASGATRTVSSGPEATSTSDAHIIGEYAATAQFNPKRCSTECKVICKIGTGVACWLSAGLICSPAEVATPAAHAACAWVFRRGCSILASSACDKYCNENACQCPKGNYRSLDCGACVQPCQLCQNGQLVEKECTTGKCSTCNPTTNACEEKLCNGQCCEEKGVGWTCCDGACTNTNFHDDHCGGCNTVCPQGKTCTDGRCECPPGSPNCEGGKVGVALGNPES
jgi:hypothetical protein